MQNTSPAVMQQRREAHDSLDDFPTPPWATRALFHHVLFPVFDGFDPPAIFSRKSVWEPACNRGYMVRPLEEFFGAVIASDVHNYGASYAVADFLMREQLTAGDPIVDWIITNPPFRLAEQFIERASQVAKDGFAVIVRTSFLEGVGRYNNLFRRNPPSIIAQFSERVPMVKGRYDPSASTATSYAWLVWIDGEPETRFVWIPPCRRCLEWEGDSE